MIILELKNVVINILFGIFTLNIINFLSLLIDKYHKPIVSNFFYFLISILCGLIYIVYIDKVFFDFKFYYLLFILIGFVLVCKISFLNINSNFILFSFLIKTSMGFFKKILLFSINYSFFKAFIINLKNIFTYFVKKRGIFYKK